MTQEIAVGNLVIKSNRETLLNFFQLVELQTSEAHIRVNAENSISFYGLDPSHISMIKAELRSDKLGWFKMTNTGYVQKFVVVPEEVVKTLKQFAKNDSLTLTIDVNADKLMISNDTTQSTIRLIDSDSNTHEAPVIRFNTDAVFDIDIDEFARASDTIAKMSERITFNVGSGVELENDGLEEGHYYGSRPRTKITFTGGDRWKANEIKITTNSISDLVSEMPVSSGYRVEPIQKVLKILRKLVYYDHSINIKFGENLPMIISTHERFTGINVKFYLAPFVSD